MDRTLIFSGISFLGLGLSALSCVCFDTFFNYNTTRVIGFLVFFPTVVVPLAVLGTAIGIPLEICYICSYPIRWISKKVHNINKF